MRCLVYAFSDLMLLIGQQEGIQPVKNWVMSLLAWLSVWGDVQICISPSWCHCHSYLLLQ